MKSYNPSHAPDAEVWLSLDESERIELVQNYHKGAGEEIDESREKLHAVFHVVVENQIAMEVEPVPTVVMKLIRQGLDRHDALHAVGAVLTTDVFALGKGIETSFNHLRYRRRLEKLTAKRWRKGQW